MSEEVRIEGVSAVPTDGTWRPVPALAAPIVVPASGAPPVVPGEPVRAAAFVSATTGWAVVGSDRPMSWLLRTEDGGVSWICQLAWPGIVLGRLRVFDANRAALLIGLWPTHRNDVNGVPVAEGEPFAYFIAGTQDAGATWALGSPPDRNGAGAFFLNPDEVWLRMPAPGSGVTTGLARTSDGGATWERADGIGRLPVIDAVFSSPRDGLIVEQDGDRADLLRATADGGRTWTPRPVPPPPGLPKTAETWLFPVLGPEPGRLLTVRAVARTRRIPGPRWEGVWAYARDGDGWSGPHRLPSAPASLDRDLLVPGPDGRLWAASGHDVWSADDIAGPWWHRRVPLPAEEAISDVHPVGDGVIWLTTGVGVGGGGLYRGDGETWTRVPVVTRY
jgi:hypothetical protein